MSLLSSDKPKGDSVRASLKAARERIRQLEQDKLLLEDSIMTSLFGTPWIPPTRHGTTGWILPRPAKHTPGKCICFYGRTLPKPRKRTHKNGKISAEHTDAEAYRVTEVYQTMALDPIWNILVAIRPDTDRVRTIELLRKITSDLEKGAKDRGQVKP